MMQVNLTLMSYARLVVQNPGLHYPTNADNYGAHTVILDGFGSSRRSDGSIDASFPVFAVTRTLLKRIRNPPGFDCVDGEEVQLGIIN